MANRVVTSVASEETTYGVWLDGAGLNTLTSRIQVGDIIVDTSSGTIDGLPSIYENDITVDFATARDGFTLWIDAAIGEMRQVRFGTGGVAWSKADTNPVTVRNLGGQVRVNFNDESSRGVEFEGMKLLNFDGESDFFPGLRSPFTTSNFLTGTFGFHFYAHEKRFGLMGLQIIVDADDFAFNVRGVETEGGFAGFRIMLGGSAYFDHNGSCIFLRVYSHDHGSGENFYFGYTGLETNGAPKMLFDAKDCILIRAAAESTQAQHTLAGSSLSRLMNIMAASDWMDPFQPNQDNSWQQIFTDGDIIMRDNITHGWGSNGFSLFGSANYTNPSPSGVVRHKNSLFLGGANLGFRQSSLSEGLEHHYEDLIIGPPSEHLLERPDKAAEGIRDFILATFTGTDLHKFKDIVHSTVKATFFEDAGANTEEQINFTTDDTLPEPEYPNLGLSFAEFRGTWASKWFAVPFQGDSILSVEDNGGGDARFLNYQINHLSNGDKVVIVNVLNKVAYNGYHTVSNVADGSFEVSGLAFIGTDVGNFGKEITYAVGKVVQYFTTNGYPDKGFYKVLVEHTPTSESDDPPSNPSNYEKLFWDVNAVRSDEVGYNGTPDPATGGEKAPDNVLLPYTDKYFLLGMGVGQQENDRRYSMLRWYIADNEEGTENKKLIFGAKERNFDIDDDRYTWVKRQTGKYVVGSKASVNSSGGIGLEAFAEGKIIA